MRVCTKCGAEKADADFDRDLRNRSGLSSWCKTCTRAQKRALRARMTPEQREAARLRRNARQRELYAAGVRVDPITRVDLRLRARYGITLAEYQELRDRQGGVCAICGTDDPQTRGDRFAVDHDHSVDGPPVVRGLLCTPCNTRLGVLELVEWRVAADAYLTRATEKVNG